MKDLLLRRALDISLIVTAVVLVVAVLATARSVTTGETRARERNVLAAFREDELTRVVIERGTERIVLERHANQDDPEENADEENADIQWRLMEPVREEAGVFEVQALLNALDHATAARRLPDSEIDRARMGLNEPRFVVSLSMGAIAYRLVVGSDAVAPEGAVYVEVSGEGAPRKGVVIVRGDVIAQLDVDVDQLREPKLAPYLSDALRELVLEGKGGKRRLKRDGDRWRFEGMNANRRADRRLLSSLFVQLVGLSAEESVPVKDAQRITAAAKDRVTVTQIPEAPGAPRAVLVIGGQCPTDETQVVALRQSPDPLAGCASRDALAILSLSADDLVSRRLFSVELSEVELFKVTSPRRQLELVRRESGFLLRQPVDTEVSLEAGTRRLTTVTNARGVFVNEPDLTALGLDPAPSRVAITTSGADEADIVREEVAVGEPDAEGFVSVLRKSDGAVLRVDRTTARALAPDATLVRPLPLFDFDARDVKRVSVSGAVEQELARKEGTLSLVRPAGVRVDAALATDLVSTLVALEAQRWEADADDGSFGLERPHLTVKMDVEKAHGESSSYELVVGAPTVGGSYASLVGDQGVFVLSRRDGLVIEQWVLDRSVFLFDPGVATRIHLATPTADIELRRVGSTFEQVGGAPQLDPHALPHLVEALGELRPEAALHLGSARTPEGFTEPVLTITVHRELSDDKEPLKMHFGSGDAWRGLSIHYARVEGVEATYVVARGLVSAILNQL